MKKLFAVVLMALAATAAVSSTSYAKHGADDPAGHVRGEGAGHP